MNKKVLKVVVVMFAIVLTFEFFSFIIENFIHGWNAPN